jgi:hypothetical protein
VETGRGEKVGERTEQRKENRAAGERGERSTEVIHAVKDASGARGGHVKRVRREFPPRSFFKKLQSVCRSRGV